MLGNRTWCVGDAITLADIAIACHLGFIMLRALQFFPQDKYPNLTRLWKKTWKRASR